MAFEAVLFDMDGTLLDTLEDLTDSLNCALESLGYPRRTQAEVCAFVGDGVINLIRRALPRGAEGALEACVSAFKAHYGENMENKTGPYPGVIELLDALADRGVKIGVVSNKFEGAVKRLSQKYFGDRMASVVGEREDKGMRKKPAPDGVLAALEEMGARPENALYSGDSDVDVQTAHNAGLKCLAVSWGFRSRECLARAGADMIVDRAADFLGAMKAMEA